MLSAFYICWIYMQMHFRLDFFMEANNMNPDQTTSSEVSWSGSTLFSKEGIIVQIAQSVVWLPGMEYSYSYLYSYLLEYFFSVLSCTLYLVKFMSTCTRTYLSTVTKTPILMSTLREPLSTFLNFNFFFKFQSHREKKLIVSQALPHLFQMPLICLFSDLEKSGLICVLGNKKYNKKPACLTCFS